MSQVDRREQAWFDTIVLVDLIDRWRRMRDMLVDNLREEKRGEKNRVECVSNDVFEYYSILFEQGIITQKDLDKDLPQ